MQGQSWWQTESDTCVCGARPNAVWRGFVALLARVLPLLPTCLPCSGPSVPWWRTALHRECPFCTSRSDKWKPVLQPVLSSNSSLGSHVCPCTSRAQVSKPLIVRQGSTKGLETSHSESLFDPTMTVIAGEGPNLPIGPGCPVDSLEHEHQDKA